MPPTPESWEVVELENGRLAVAVSGTGLAVCQMKQPRSIAEPKARLIAQAPALLAIAEGVLMALRYPRGSEAQVRCLEEVGQDAELAIKAAKGGAPSGG